MIFKEEVMQIIDKRDSKFVEWLKTDPEKLSIPKLKKKVKEFWQEVSDARKFSEENDSKIPKDELGFAYTFMNEYSAWRCHDRH